MASQLDLDFIDKNITALGVSTPRSYKGLSAFHKYWGKKPIECLGYLIENLTKKNELIIDPFLGSGLVAREAINRERKFIGIDINPISIELTKFFINPPSPESIAIALDQMESEIKPRINSSYNLKDGKIATHYLWEGSKLIEIWVTGGNRKRRIEYNVSDYDLELINQFSSYRSKFLRELNLFQNSRINTNPNLSIKDIFTGRAQRNIDLILDYIYKQPINLRRALILILTSSSGQMSNMVFAIQNRGKANGKQSDRIEVGSWVIGFWRPLIHFEINVWNCYRNRTRKLLNALAGLNSQSAISIGESIKDIQDEKASIVLLNKDAKKATKEIPSGSVSLVLTDPPHSDRIPYLELSEMWNSILDREVSFDDEVVVSNARGRNKNKDNYNKDMNFFFLEIQRVLQKNGYMALIFNARDKLSWHFLLNAKENMSGMKFHGCFPVNYSANSVVQDNRKGSMKNDYVLIFQKRLGRCEDIKLKSLYLIPGWKSELPVCTE